MQKYWVKNILFCIKPMNMIDFNLIKNFIRHPIVISFTNLRKNNFTKQTIIKILCNNICSILNIYTYTLTYIHTLCKLECESLKCEFITKHNLYNC